MRSDGIVYDIHYGDVLIKFGSILDMENEDVPYIGNGKEGKTSAQLQDGDIVIADTAEDETAGKAVEIYNAQRKRIEAGLHTIPCRPISTYAPMYLGYYMNSAFYHSQLLSLLQGVKVLSISKANISKTVITSPQSKMEQKKISSVLYLIDLKVKKQRQVIDTLKKYKRGLLQNMFPQKGEKVPRLRFAGFTGDWEQCKFSDVVATRRGLTYKPSNIRKNGVRVLRSSNIAEDSFTLNDDDVFVAREAVNIDFARVNDILITAANGSSRLVGKHTIIRGIPEESAVHGGFMLLGTTKEPYFINASMGSSWYRHFIELFVAGGNGAIGNLNKNDLDNQEIAIPLEEEQKKVGAFFRQLDHLITLHQHKCEVLQKERSGLLQQLFI